MTYFPFLLIALICVLLVVDTRKGILAGVIARPLIDCFWEAQYAVFGFKPTELMGVVFPTLVFFKILVSTEHRFTRYPYCTVWVIFTYFQLFSSVMIGALGQGFIQGLNFFFRAFNGFIGFFAFQEFFNRRDDFRTLLIAHIIAGLAPLGMSVYQNIFGGVIRSEMTVGFLTRNIGFYHDAYTLRYYSFQTLTALILFGAYFTGPRQYLAKGLLTGLGLLCIMTVCRIFSKAGYFILVEWALIWNLLRKRIVIVIMLVIAASVMLSFMNLEWADNIETVYMKEIAALKGEGKTELAFQGRWFGWRHHMNKWLESPIHLKLIGNGDIVALGMHNDFLRALMGTGVIGLVLYVVILSWATIKAVTNCMRKSTPLNLMALMLVVMWITDAMGLVPGAYPGYQIYVWGFVGLAFRGVEGLDDPVSDRASV